jgi:hypothetical protein
MKAILNAIRTALRSNVRLGLAATGDELTIPIAMVPIAALIRCKMRNPALAVRRIAFPRQT